MSNKPKFFICKHCGNLIETINYSGVKIICCGEPMNELVSNTVDTATEKHIPVVNIIDNIVTVTVGSVPHPMTPAHHIAWIYVETKQGGARKNLPVDGEPTLTFSLTNDEEVVSVYAYCNLHGLWKIDL